MVGVADVGLAALAPVGRTLLVVGVADVERLVTLARVGLASVAGLDGEAAGLEGAAGSGLAAVALAAVVCLAVAAGLEEVASLDEEAAGSGFFFGVVAVTGLAAALAFFVSVVVAVGFAPMGRLCEVAVAAGD